jgi:hypothetical protein
MSGDQERIAQMAAEIMAWEQEDGKCLPAEIEEDNFPGRREQTATFLGEKRLRKDQHASANTKGEERKGSLEKGGKRTLCDLEVIEKNLHEL